VSRGSSRALGAVALATLVAACGASAPHASTRPRAAAKPRASAARRVAPAPRIVAARRPPAPRPKPPSLLPRVLPAARAAGPSGLVPAVTVAGHTAVRVARLADGVTLLAFDQRLVSLHLHSGTLDAGSSGWRFGPVIAGVERHRLVAAFNGGFRLTYGAGGFESYGRVAVALRAGIGSIVTYADGYSDIGTWDDEVPHAGHGPVVSVRQNLAPLIDHGTPAGNLGCIECWGATLGGVSAPARSALGITASGTLVWAGGEQLTPAALAQALLGVGVVRAVELDINPEWVAAYLYAHTTPHGAPAAVPMVAGQPGIPGELLAPYSRDFFTVVAR
jgi:hypothetical protein